MEIRETRRYDSSPRKDVTEIITTVKVFYLYASIQQADPVQPVSQQPNH